MWIATFFYDELGITMEIDTKFRFVPMPYSMQEATHRQILLNSILTSLKIQTALREFRIRNIKKIEVIGYSPYVQTMVPLLIFEKTIYIKRRA